MSRYRVAQPSGPLRMCVLALGGVVFPGEAIWRGREEMSSAHTAPAPRFCSEATQHVVLPAPALALLGIVPSPLAAGCESGHWDPLWARPLWCWVVVAKPLPFPGPQLLHLLSRGSDMSEGFPASLEKPQRSGLSRPASSQSMPSGLQLARAGPSVLSFMMWPLDWQRGITWQLERMQACRPHPRPLH